MSDKDRLAPSSADLFADASRNTFSDPSSLLSHATQRLLLKEADDDFEPGVGGKRPRARWRPSDWLLGTGEGQWFGLIVLGFLLIVFGTLSWSATGGNADHDDTIVQSSWISWGLFFDPGTQTGILPTDKMKVKVVAVIYSVLGFIFNLAMLGLIVDQLRTRLRIWEHKRGRIILNEHTLILGWSERTLFLLTELLRAYEQEMDSTHLVAAAEEARRCCGWVRCCGRARRCCTRRRRVIIMAKRDVMEMQEETHAHLRSLHPPMSCAGIHFWNGDPTNWRELLQVSPQSTADIIILGQGVNANESDHHVLQIILALAALPVRKRRASRVTPPQFGEVFAEIRINENAHVGSEILGEASGVVARHPVNRMLCLLGLEPAVGKCLIEVASFMRGNQLYFTPVPSEMVGYSFEQAHGCYPNAVLVGVKARQTGGSRRSLRTTSADGIAPSPDAVLEGGDELILFAPGRHAATIFSLPEAAGGQTFMSGPLALKTLMCEPNHAMKESTRKKICILGCPVDFPDFIRLFNVIVAPDSEVHILSERTIEDRQKWSEAAHQDMSETTFANCEMDNFKLRHWVGPPSSARHLVDLEVNKAHCVFILSESHSPNEDPTAADARNLNTLITLRGLKDFAPHDSRLVYPADEQNLNKPHCQVVCELLDPRSEHVVQGNHNLKHLAEYFYSNKLETAMIAMAAENRKVFNTLMIVLQPRSMIDIIAVPIHSFVNNAEEKLNFWEMNARVRSVSGGLLLGWERHGEVGRGRHKPVVNPHSTHGDEPGYGVMKSAGKVVKSAGKVVKSAGALSGLSKRCLDAGKDVGKDEQLLWKQDSDDLLIIIRREVEYGDGTQDVGVGAPLMVPLSPLLVPDDAFGAACDRHAAESPPPPDFASPLQTPSLPTAAQVELPGVPVSPSPDSAAKTA